MISEPIQGGWVRLQGNRVVEIAAGKPPECATDLGDVAILPGLVNAHTHLEFSDCAQPIGQPGVPLAQWIGQVIAARSATTTQARQQAIQAGLAESVAAGVCLMGDIATPPIRYDGDTIDLVSFAEVVGLGESRWRERLQSATDYNKSFEKAAWSPHAPYSTSTAAIDACVQRAKTSGRPLSMHVAESPAERELLCSGTGPFATALRSIGVWQDDLFPWPGDPLVDLIDQLAESPHALLIHGNDLRSKEISAIAQHANLTVVYCPRTHAFFGYDRHPVADMIRAGIPVALGTDSRASNPDLNLWSEVQFLLQHRMDIDPGAVIGMATVAGANALGRRDVGRLVVGGSASLGVVTTEAADRQALYRDLAQHAYRPFAS
ncbi:Aminodeoxyfutalosine deaminase [Planctomycetes bacterium K23_9]|uniref:Aminodeoxyfutalosine deaminase n=1 Tax=Stieleria marina TaxID=1930275 RepID=A0A517P2W1_9BACT|nr:Aminodeoxyfutalosine deaminase [Planctomycetes bacterium K23_9]